MTAKPPIKLKAYICTLCGDARAVLPWLPSPMCWNHGAVPTVMYEAIVKPPPSPTPFPFGQARPESRFRDPGVKEPQP